MIKKILFIALLGAVALSLLGLGLSSWVGGEFYFELVDKHSRPFTYGRYYPCHVITNKQYPKLHIKEMSYDWEGKGKGNAGIFLKDEIWEGKYAPNKERYMTQTGYDSLTGEHQYGLFGIEELIEKNINLAKFFKGKKRGDKFKYTVKIVYSFDDEPESIQIIEYNVTMITGRLHATLMRIIVRIIAPFFR